MAHREHLQLENFGCGGATTAPHGLATKGSDTGTFNTSTGAYTGPVTHLRGFGNHVPVAVAEACSITWYCQPATFGDIHATTAGYDFIGSLIVKDLASH